MWVAGPSVGCYDALCYERVPVPFPTPERSNRIENTLPCQFPLAGPLSFWDRRLVPNARHFTLSDRPSPVIRTRYRLKFSRVVCRAFHARNFCVIAFDGEFLHVAFCPHLGELISHVRPIGGAVVDEIRRDRDRQHEPPTFSGVFWRYEFSRLCDDCTRVHVQNATSRFAARV